MKLDTVDPKFDKGCANVDVADVWVNAGLPKVGRCPNVDPGTEA